MDSLTERILTVGIILVLGTCFGFLAGTYAADGVGYDHTRLQRLECEAPNQPAPPPTSFEERRT